MIHLLFVEAYSILKDLNNLIIDSDALSQPNIPYIKFKKKKKKTKLTF